VPNIKTPLRDYRVNGVVRNMDSWYEASNVKRERLLRVECGTGRIASVHARTADRSRSHLG
jgi:hypothetical protein